MKKSDLLGIISIGIFVLAGLTNSPYVGWALIGLLVVVDFFISYFYNKEQDERQRLLKLQSDSISLHVIILALLILMLVYPESQTLAATFWIVIGVGLLGRFIAWVYQRAKGL